MTAAKLTYGIFYSCFVLVIFVAMFFEASYLVYVKPSIPISLILVSIFGSEKMNLYYIISMVILMVNDTFVYLNFKEYFDLVAVCIITFYLLCMLLLRKFIALKDLQIKKIITFPIITSGLLMGYLIVSISQLVLPSLMESIVSFFAILIALLSFALTCFLIYIIDRYKGNVRLFASANCCLFVNALLLINHFYYHTRIFTVLVNVAEIAGLYFFLRFLMEAKQGEMIDEKNQYL